MTADEAILWFIESITITGERRNAAGSLLPFETDASSYGKDFDLAYKDASIALYDKYDVTHYSLFKEDGVVKFRLFRNAGFGCSFGGPMIYEIEI